MCRLYGVTRAGYYAWHTRGQSRRAQENEKLAERIQRVHLHSRHTYGSPRVYQALRSQGCEASENRVARVMRKHGIKARVATIRYTNPGLKRFFAGAGNAQLDLQPDTVDQVWVGDITYLKVGDIYR